MTIAPYIPSLPPAFAPLVQLHNYPWDSIKVVGTEEDVALSPVLPLRRYLLDTPDGRMMAGWERFSKDIHGDEPIDGECLEAYEPDGTPVILVPWMDLAEV